MEFDQDKNTIKKIVEEVLEEDIKARDSDVWLILQTLRKLGFKIFIDYRDFEKIPSFETITRIRRLIQNTERRFLPSEEVEEGRKHQHAEGLSVNSNFDVY